MKVVIVGGGIIGLCTAYYLRKTGAQVIILEKTDGNNGASFGNAGYLSPSHFIPLASPGLIRQALKWMFNSSSPFYMKPRLDIDFIQWGLKFWSNANEKTVTKNSYHLNSFLQYSRLQTIEIASEIGISFDLELKGCYMMCREQKTFDHEKELCSIAKDFGIETKIMSHEDLLEAEPEALPKSIGAVFFPIDAHLHPIKWVMSMKQKLIEMGVVIQYNTELTDFKINGKVIENVEINGEAIQADHFIIAAGAWLPEVVKKLGIHLLLQAGKGYSITIPQVKTNLNRPAILVDDRVAMTPLGKDLRIGGTMELSGINHDVHMNRVKAIVKAVNNNFANIKIEEPKKEDAWCGLRPVTPDGLPYIGNISKYNNLTIAGGHAMLGISLAAGTGKIISDLIEGKNPEINIEGFRVERF